MVYAEGAFFDEDYIYQQQGGICRRYILLQGLCVSNAKYVCKKFNTSFQTKDHKTHQDISVYTLLNQVTRGVVKNSFRERRDIFIFNLYLQGFFLTLIYDMLSSFRLYYIQFKEVKFLRETGAGGPITQVLVWLLVRIYVFCDLNDSFS